ncbi:hypothetical protein COO60DRAFT_377479 [Scenedesmus sp. NREL 46B-D3]|nr:hypothetical protein COO60DRAFT_377479 [Scenedesmus sp. NREL 46B-D3]
MTVKLSSGKLHPLTQPNNRFAAFVPGGCFPNVRGDVTPARSPDGSCIAFSSQTASNVMFEVVSVRAVDGKDLRRVANGGFEQHVTVAWQPVSAQNDRGWHACGACCAVTACDTCAWLLACFMPCHHSLHKHGTRNQGTVLHGRHGWLRLCALNATVGLDKT